MKITTEMLSELNAKGYLNDKGMDQLILRLEHPEKQQEIEDCKEVVWIGKEPRYIQCPCGRLFLPKSNDIGKSLYCKKCRDAGKS